MECNEVKMVGESGVEDISPAIGSGSFNLERPDVLVRIADDVHRILLLFHELLDMHGCTEKRQDR